MGSSTTNGSDRETVAVIGGGVSGLSAAYLLRRSHDVTLFEADSRLGGHAHTHDIESVDGSKLALDSGFIVMNEKTYPNLVRLFAELGIETRATEMSMSIACDGCGLEYAGGRGFGGIFAQKRRLLDRRYLTMLAQVKRFHRAAHRVLEDEQLDPTWTEFLVEGGYSDYFIDHFAIPLVSCVWSCDALEAGDFPARHLFAFLDHHGMLQVTGSPEWRTVVGGSHRYVERIESMLGDVRLTADVTALRRHADHVELQSSDGQTYRFDRVVVATHADQALTLLTDATEMERRDLAAIGYSENQVTIHRDDSLLPEAAPARASWNFRATACRKDSASAGGVVVSYWMNRLQDLGEVENHIVSLNAEASIDPSLVIARVDYAHPIFTRDAVDAAARLRDSGGPRLAFAGAHLGWGFHEDGARSGVAAAEVFGASW